MSDMSGFKPENMRKRFHELGAKRESIISKSGPIREARDKLWREADAAMKKMNSDIKRIEAELYDIDMERGALVRALKGQTGTPDDH